MAVKIQNMAKISTKQAEKCVQLFTGETKKLFAFSLIFHRKFFVIVNFVAGKVDFTHYLRSGRFFIKF
jgi:hypothetical protein